MKKTLLSEVRQMQKIAGILKEYIESHPESIAEAFAIAGIDLSKPVTYVRDFGNPGGADEPVTVLGGQLLRELQAEREEGEAEDPYYNQNTGITYNIEDINQGVGELFGDDRPEMEGKECKLEVYFSDHHLYEIWQ